MFGIKILPMRDHNKTYDLENNDEYVQKPKALVEKCNKVSKPFKTKTFLWKLYLWSVENFF